MGFSDLNEEKGAKRPHRFQEPPAAPYCGLCGAGRLHQIHSSNPVPDVNCADCRAAMAHAYSDATTPGFFSPFCDKHRPL